MYTAHNTQQYENESQRSRRGRLVVENTPGLSDTRSSNEKVIEKISHVKFWRGIYKHHAIVSEVKVEKTFSNKIGEVERYRSVSSTRAGQFEKPVDDFIHRSDQLEHIRRKYSNRNYAIDYKTKSRQETEGMEIMNLFDVMVEESDGTFYPNEWYKRLTKKEEKLQFEMIRHKDLSNALYQQQLIDMEKEVKARQLNDLERMQKRQDSKAEMQNAIANERKCDSLRFEKKNVKKK